MAAVYEIVAMALVAVLYVITSAYNLDIARRFFWETFMEKQANRKLEIMWPIQCLASSVPHCHRNHMTRSIPKKLVFSPDSP